MPDGLYDRDAVAWAEQQADLLRRLAAGERLNAAVDWPHVIEEVQDVGRSELRACESNLVQALHHLLKLYANPVDPAASHWAAEAAAFLANTRRAFTPSMRQRIDIADLYADALQQFRLQAGGAASAGPMPQACPYGLDDLIAPRPDITTLVAKIRP